MVVVAAVVVVVIAVVGVIIRATTVVAPAVVEGVIGIWRVTAVIAVRTVSFIRDFDRRRWPPHFDGCKSKETSERAKRYSRDCCFCLPMLSICDECLIWGEKGWTCYCGLWACFICIMAGAWVWVWV